MRAPNGYGTVYKLNGRRRKPWVFRVTIGYKENSNGGLSPIVKTVGTYESQRKAYQARDEYNRTKHADYIPTFKECAEAFNEEHFSEIAETTRANYVASLLKCSTIAHKAVSDISHVELQELVKSQTEGTQAILRSYLRQVFQYAMHRDYIAKNPADGLKVKTSKSTIHYRFTSDEIEKLKAAPKSPMRDYILLTIYTGARPAELLEGEFKNGCLIVEKGKTENARRFIPIHKDAAELVQAFDFGNIRTFRDAHAAYLKSIGILEYVHPETGQVQKHKPHDGRHTFTTLWKEQRLDDGIRRYIQGHTQADIAGKVYTHYDIDVLRDELNRLKV